MRAARSLPSAALIISEVEGGRVRIRHLPLGSWHGLNFHREAPPITMNDPLILRLEGAGHVHPDRAHPESGNAQVPPRTIRATERHARHARQRVGVPVAAGRTPSWHPRGLAFCLRV